MISKQTNKHYLWECYFINELRVYYFVSKDKSKVCFNISETITGLFDIIYIC